VREICCVDVIPGSTLNLCSSTKTLKHASTVKPVSPVGGQITNPKEKTQSNTSLLETCHLLLPTVCIANSWNVLDKFFAITYPYLS